MQGKESMLRKNDYRYRSDTSRFVIFLYLLDKRHAIENDRLLARRGEKRKKTVILRLGLTRGDVIPVVPAGWTTSTGSSMRGCPRFMESSTRIIGGNVGTSCWTPTRICRPNCRACTRLGKRGKEPRRKGNLAKTATRYPSWRENHGRWAFYYYYYLSIFYIFLSSKLFLCGNFQAIINNFFSTLARWTRFILRRMIFTIGNRMLSRELVMRFFCRWKRKKLSVEEYR